MHLPRSTGHLRKNPAWCTSIPLDIRFHALINAWGISLPNMKQKLTVDNRSSYILMSESVSLRHRILWREVWDAYIKICRYILIISAVKAYRKVRKRIRMDIRSCYTTGPTMSASFNDNPVRFTRRIEDHTQLRWLLRYIENTMMW